MDSVEEMVNESRKRTSSIVRRRGRQVLPTLPATGKLSSIRLDRRDPRLLYENISLAARINVTGAEGV